MIQKDSNYNQKVLSIFNVISCHFVDMFYNHIYITARTRYKNDRSVDKTKTSITEEYKHAIIHYINAINNKREYYVKTIERLHTYFQMNTKFSTINLNEFIDLILQHYLPEEHFSILSEPEKEFFINKIVVHIIKELGCRLLETKYLKMVIDNHNNVANAKQWIDLMVEIQVLERDNIFKKFARKISNKADTVSIDVLDNIKQNFSKVLKEKCYFENQATKYETLNSELKKIAIDLNSRCVTLHNENSQLKSSLSKYLNDSQPTNNSSAINTTNVNPNNSAIHSSNVNSSDMNSNNANNNVEIPYFGNSADERVSVENDSELRNEEQNMMGKQKINDVIINIENENTSQNEEDDES